MGTVIYNARASRPQMTDSMTARGPRPPIAVADGDRLAPECLDLLRELVECESPTGDTRANLHVAAILEAFLRGVGGQVERIEAPRYGDHLLARFPGKIQDSERPVLLLGHMDTVHPVGTLRELPFEVAGDRVRGPGVYDMKGGLAVSLFALRLLAERGSGARTGLACMVTCDEEVGSPHSRERIQAEAGRHRAALVVEPSAPGGAVKTRRKGVADYVLGVRGESAHAGIEPEAGASAIHELARQICGIYDLSNPGAKTTLNVGLTEGGTRSNVVARRASCTIDVRFFSNAEAERVDAALRGACPHDPRCRLSLQGGVNRPALEKTDASEALYRAAAAVAADLGFGLGEASTGGASDGNLTAAVGCPTLDGIGPDGRGAHTLKEYILREEVGRRIAFLARLIETL